MCPIAKELDLSQIRGLKTAKGAADNQSQNVAIPLLSPNYMIILSFISFKCRIY
jgi:hypothetical protein